MCQSPEVRSSSKPTEQELTHLFPAWISPVSRPAPLAEKARSSTTRRAWRPRLCLPGWPSYQLLVARQQVLNWRFSDFSLLQSWTAVNTVRRKYWRISTRKSAGFTLRNIWSLARRCQTARNVSRFFVKILNSFMFKFASLSHSVITFYIHYLL